MSPTITYLEFQATSTPLVAKLYPVGGVDDSILAVAGSIIQLDDPESDETGRWRASFISLTARDYQLIATEGGGSVVADERYTVTADTVSGIIQPWSEAKPMTAADVTLTVNVNAAAIGTRQRSSSNVIAVFLRDRGFVTLPVLDADKAPVDLSAETLELVISDYDWHPETEVLAETVLATIADADLTVGGTDDNVVTFDVPAAAVAKLGQFAWSLRRVSDGYVFGAGEWAVSYAAGGN
jgi:hypothetical protein